MANKKITSLTALATAPATNDLVPIVDVSDTTDSANGTTKKLTVANLFTTPTIGSFTNATHNHTNAAGGGQLTDSALSSAIGIAKGGTGQTTATEAFDALAPTTTAGDIIYHNGSDNIRLAKGSAGQGLKINSAGTAPEWGAINSKLEIDATEITVSGTASETTLFDVSVPGGTLSTNSAIRIKIYCSNFGLNTNATTTIRLKYGATTIATAVNTGNGAGVVSSLKGWIEGYLVADGSANAQKGVIGFLFVEDGGVAERVADAAVGFHKVMDYGNGAATEDSSGALTLTVSAQQSSTNGNSTITAEFWVVEVIK